MKAFLASLGCFGFLALVGGLYVLSVLWWSLWIMLVVHWAGLADWSYSYVATHWGLLAPFILG